MLRSGRPQAGDGVNLTGQQESMVMLPGQIEGQQPGLCFLKIMGTGPTQPGASVGTW